MQPSYHSFAKFYDQIMGEPKEKAAMLHQLIQKYHPGARKLLEVACGTGAVLAELAHHYSITGVDLSPQMLEVARQKLPRAQLHQADMSGFVISERFDAIICVFDSINHLQKWEDWEKLFERAASHLEPGGVFVFDFNTISRLGWLAEQPVAVQQFGDNYLFMNVQANQDRFDWHITIFEQVEGNSYQRHNEVIPEVSFPLDQVERAVGQHFEILESFSSEPDRAPSDNVDRVYLVCQKA